nr:MAG TPA: hypothetical protein [Caudoviricetes sp.]
MRNFASCNTRLSFRLSSHLYSQLNRRYTLHCGYMSRLTTFHDF